MWATVMSPAESAAAVAGMVRSRRAHARPHGRRRGRCCRRRRASWLWWVAGFGPWRSRPGPPTEPSAAKRAVTCGARPTSPRPGSRQHRLHRGGETVDRSVERLHLGVTTPNTCSILAHLSHKGIHAVGCRTHGVILLGQCQSHVRVEPADPREQIHPLRSSHDTTVAPVRRNLKTTHPRQYPTAAAGHVGLPAPGSVRGRRTLRVSLAGTGGRRRSPRRRHGGGGRPGLSWPCQRRDEAMDLYALVAVAVAGLAARSISLPRPRHLDDPAPTGVAVIGSRWRGRWRRAGCGCARRACGRCPAGGSRPSSR